MELFNVGCKVENVADPRKSAVVPRLLVDTGSEFTWIDQKILDQIGVERRKKDVQIQMANGQIITRSVGYAVVRVDKSETVDEVVFAEKGDLLLLGSRALEGLNLRVDARHKKLVAAGPVIAAAAMMTSFSAF
jgi:predicted aspartyl protease